MGGCHGGDRWRPPLALAAATPDILVPGGENPYDFAYHLGLLVKRDRVIDYS